MARTQEALNAIVRRRLSSFALSTQQWRVLEVLSAREASSISELATRAQLGLPSASRIVAELARRGMIAVDAGGAKSKRISLAWQGRRIVAACAPFFAACSDKIESLVGLDLLETLEILLEEIEERIGDCITQKGGKHV